MKNIFYINKIQFSLIELKLGLLILLASVSSLYSTHIVGGEMYYECLGSDNYHLTLKVYRDCFNGQAPFDDPAYIGVYNNNVLIQQIDLPLDTSKIVQLPTRVLGKCYTPPTNICVEQYVYDTIINLPPLAGGYTLLYQRCCRNNSILNLTNAGNVGTTYFTQIPDQSIVTCNQSPHFVSYPPIFLCQGVPLKYDHVAIDPDGDSLVYELCDTYSGATSFNPYPTPPLSMPTLTPVPWLAGYNGGYPISSSPVIAINSQTGEITGTPNMIGQWVVGICVREYRNGNLIGTHKRDFQFNVLDCPFLIVSSIPSQQKFCDGNTIQFGNNSVNSTKYHWDFGISALTNDTSDLFTPSYTYPDTGIYVVTLIANRGDTCIDTSTTTFHILPVLKPNYVPPIPQCALTNNYNFTGRDTNTNVGVTYKWDFGINATPQFSSLKSPTGIVFATPGKYNVTFTVNDYGCSQSYIDSVTVLPPPVPAFIMPPGQCINSNSFDFTATGNVTGAATYAWSFIGAVSPLTGNTKTINSVTYNKVGAFPVDLTITDNNCIVTITDTVVIYPLPKANFDPTPSQGCTPLMVQFSDSSLAGTTINYKWKFGDGDSATQKNPVHIYKTPGVYTVALTIITTNGCVDTLTFINPDMVTAVALPSANLSADPLLTTISDPHINFIDLSSGATSCKLLFGDGDSAMNCSTTHTYLKPGIYKIQQTVMNGFGCVDTFYIDVEIDLESTFWIPNTFTPNKDGLNDIFIPLMEGVSDYRFTIFDRWGVLIFDTKDQLKGWDGVYKGNVCQQDGYVYKIEFNDVKAAHKTYVGIVNLLR